MKRNMICWFLLSAAIMLLIPWMAVTFIKGDGGMAVCFLLFFGINPIYSVAVGTFAGKSIRQLWHLPFISAVLFLMGTWMFFDIGETAFFLYAVVYLCLGICAMLITVLVHKLTGRRGNIQ